MRFRMEHHTRPSYRGGNTALTDFFSYATPVFFSHALRDLSTAAPTDRSRLGEETCHDMNDADLRDLGLGRMESVSLQGNLYEDDEWGLLRLRSHIPRRFGACIDCVAL